MSPYDEFDPETGESRAAVWRRQHAERNFVAPAPAPLATRPQTVDVVPSWAMQAQPLDVSNAWQPLQTAKEATSAVDRAKGLQMRVLPFLGLYALAGVVVGGVVWYVAGIVPLAALAAVLVFAALGISTYRRMNLDDYDHSGAGVERLRITEAADLERARMEHEQVLRERALDAYLKQMENRNR